MSGCVHCLVVGLVPQVGVNPVMVSVQAKEKEVDVTPVYLLLKLLQWNK